MTYRSSIDDSVLELFLIANWIEALTIDEVMEEEPKACIEECAHIDEKDYDLGIIERDIFHVQMEKPCREANLEKQIWRSCLKYKTTRKKCGYDNFIDTKPKLAIRHIYRKITDRSLKTSIKLILDLHKEEYEIDFHNFVRKAVEEAKTVDLKASARRDSVIMEAENPETDLVRTSKGIKERNHSRYEGKERNRNSTMKQSCAEENKKDSKPGVPDRYLMQKLRCGSCLNPDCKENHRLRDYENTSVEVFSQSLNRTHRTTFPAPRHLEGRFQFACHYPRSTRVLQQPIAIRGTDPVRPDDPSSNSSASAAW
ncbi:hypothetical protein BWQ96_05036 [Gracilariopsis chorda]|uniref:Uncharacterized protein n=1 Tax=Gracilariopsis chorda TaxID=448386 RepID=A0A2V3ISV8_9FLOR|nr:hypothetical protein BWQ96_05036 [Gracilariopsis chorda]|eukprot:PXF45206.1 hypothetical protein BWQ96_05036 [Gracilariopsis chorda]